jgi:DNA replication licensing factor MCM4
MTNSQSTRARSDIPSSPFRQMTDTQSDIDPQRTPRANPTTPAYHGGEK